MGSQTLEILRQGVWASLTGGWFYDPHQNVFCNAVHLYIWLFLLCAPFITYLYFPRTFTTWGVYCFTTAFTVTILKIINMALHILYDRAQNLSDSNPKKPLKGLRESRGEDDCGIEMQVLGADMPSQTSAEQQINETSGANSMLSIDCQDQVTSTIDLKVDVHRKNSSESSDSIGMCTVAGGPSSYRNEMSKVTNHRKSLKVKSKSEERPSKNPAISEEVAISQDCDRKAYELPSTSQITDSFGDSNKITQSMEEKRKNCLERQSSFDVSEASVLELSLARQQSVHICCDIDVDNFSEAISKRVSHKSTKLQRHRSSESNDDRPRRNRGLFMNHREQQSGNDIRNPLQSLASDLYLESNYAKSDLGIESIENNNSKIYLLQQPKPMRKDSSSTMSALQLSVASSQPNNTRKRRHSNTGCKPITNQTPSVRRIKSAALEISCPQPSVSNLSPHPNSAEAISGQQIKNPQSAMLPPPSKCLVRNPHLNLCPKLNSLGNNSSGIIVEPVYPIAEQADEKSLNETFIFSAEIDSDGENTEKLASAQRKRCSTTESESDMDRPRAQSTDSETDNNGSRSPLLNKTSRHIDKYKNVTDDTKQKIAASVANFVDVTNGSNLASRYKSGDSGCPSSDCEQTSASSKDMLLSREKSGESNFKRWSGYSEKDVKENVAPGDEENISESIQKEEEPVGKKAAKDGKHLGAIPKTSTKKDDLNEYMPPKKALGAIPKSTSRTSSSASSRSFSAESFSNEIYKSYKDQWLMVGGPGHSQTVQPSLGPGCVHNMHNDILFSNYSRRNFFDPNYPMQPKLRREGARRNKKHSDNRTSKLEEISTTLEFGSDDLQNTGNGTLSIQGLMNEHYSFENAIPTEQRLSTGQIRCVEFNDSVCCGYWRTCSLTAEKPAQPKRFYKYRLHFFGRRELKISMDRLQLLALFDRDLHWFHVILAIFLSIAVCLLGATILQMGFYKDIFAFLFCVVIAGSQYSLLKSVQPDAASPIHGFNKTVAYSRPIYFCVCSGLLVLSHHLALELNSNEAWVTQQLEINIFGVPFSPETFLYALTKIMSIVLLLLPIFFSLGLFPQINTFCMYILEQIDMHVFGGSAACSLAASLICVLKSILAVCILYGPAYGGLIEQKGTQHVLFSIFCALLIPISYHLSRTASDFTHVWALIKSSIISYPEDEDEEDNKSSRTTCQTKISPDCSQKKLDEMAGNDELKEDITCSERNDTGDEHTPAEVESPDPLPKKLQHTVNTRLKNDLVVSSALALIIFGLHGSTVFTVLQPDLNTVLYSIAGILGFCLHYILPQMRKHLPWLCFSQPILRQNEFGKFEVSDAAKIMWFEVLYVCLCFLERNVLYPLIFISALTADSTQIVQKFGIPFGAVVVSICALKCVRSAYSDVANQYLILIFSVLLFKIDFSYASETFLVDYFVVSIIFRKSCDFLLKIQFIVTYIAPWQITWGSAFHAFAQPFSVPHSAMLFMQAGISAVLSTPLNPFLGSAIFLTSYARPIKFWERDYNTRRIDHSNTRLSSQLERDLGADDNNLNSIFYEHLTRSLQHSLCGDLLMGRWGPVNQGDCFVLASDYLNCLVHIIELGNGLCTFQMRGLEFRGTYCQQREVEAISEGVEDNDGCCCCTPGHLPRMLSANAMFTTRWLAWQVVAAQYVLEGYSISENLATATLQVFEFRKVLITYYIKSIIYYVTRNTKLEEWLSAGPIQDALTNTLNRQFVDLDPIFNYNLDEDFDFRALGITRTSFCSVYMGWIQFCFTKRKSKDKVSAKEEESDTRNSGDASQCRDRSSYSTSTVNVNSGEETAGANGDNGSPKTNEKNKAASNNKNEEMGEGSSKPTAITKDSPLVSLCLALGLLARRTLATASHSSLSGVEFFLHGLHALFKGDFRITSPRDEWVFADMELLHGVVAPAVKMALKLHQDHFSSPDEYLDPAVLYEAITSHSKDLVISHEADPMWRSAVLRGAPNLLALRHVMEEGSDEYRIIRLTKRFLNFRVIKLNRECVRGLWAGQQQELIYLRNRNPERGSIQNAKQALRNIINSSCDQPIGYPIYVSPLTTSYAETNTQLCRIIGGSITLDTIRTMAIEGWNHIRQRCREGCSSGSGGLDCDVTNEVPGVYFSPAAVNSTSATLPYGSQSLSCAGTRGSLASMNKPTSSTLIAGFLNRERDQERETVRERSSKKNIQSRSERERRATLPIASSAASENSKEFASFKEGMGSTNSGLRHIDIPEASHSTKMFCSSGNLGAEGLKCISSDSPKRSHSVQPEVSVNRERDEFARAEGPHSLIELNKKVIIVDGTEIYDCLDLGRRIDVVWPNEKMRACGGRSSWKDWLPKEGMVGYVVHYWQPNHPDQRFRSNVNRTLYLVEIGERFVPVGESGIREYNQITDIASNRSFIAAISGAGGPTNSTISAVMETSAANNDIPMAPKKAEIKDNSNSKENNYCTCDSKNQTELSFNDDGIIDDDEEENENVDSDESSGSLSSTPDKGGGEGENPCENNSGNCQEMRFYSEDSTVGETSRNDMS